jgi:RimJ/RimL family protein N-acetyltransferase
MGHPYWPLFDLRVRTPHLELRYPDDSDAVALATLAANGIHPPDSMPFAAPWSLAPSPQLERDALRFFWRKRAEFTPEEWEVPFAVVNDGVVVGTQAVLSKAFGTTRAFISGSWLGKEHQGKGTGKEMRAAVLHFGFVGLGATVAYSGAWHDNAPSLAVSKSLGYRANGDEIRARIDKPARMINLKLTRAMWEKGRRDDIVIEGLEACLDLFGLVGDPAAV